MQVVRSAPLEKDQHRREKYARFKHMLKDLCEGGGEFRFVEFVDSFPIACGHHRVDTVEHQDEVLDVFFTPFVDDVVSNPQHVFMAVGRGFGKKVHSNCLYVETADARRADVVMGSCSEYPVADGSIDGIGCLDIMSYPEPWKIVREFHRILKPGGKLYMGWPFLQSDFERTTCNCDAASVGISRILGTGFDKIGGATLKSHTPDHTLTRILTGWGRGLKSDTVRNEFYEKTVGELIAMPPGSEFWRTMIADTTPETMSAYACGNALIARKG